MNRFEAYVSLNMAADIGGVRLKRLLEVFDNPENIFQAPHDKLTRVWGIGNKTAEKISSFKQAELDKELVRARKSGLAILTMDDPGYPKNLLDIYDPPIVLYVKGKLEEQDNIAIGIVGSRRASFYGLSCAEKFAYSLAQKGVAIVSGMARGVDTSAHKGALRAGGRTLAVIGSGFDNLYPPENLKLAEQIAGSGAVISEFAMGTLPLPQNFPRRNRVISGLSLGILVAEAARNSGALITADFALEQGREVFALPGKIDSQLSSGANELIKQGARLVTCPQELLEELYLPVCSRLGPTTIMPAAKPRISASGTDEENRIYEALRLGPVCLDEMAEKTDIEIPRLLGILLKMQIKKRVRQVPGNNFTAYQ